MSNVDITKWPEGAQEVVKHMDYLPEEERMGVLMGFVFKLFAL